MLNRGLAADDVVKQLTDADEGRDHRQLGVVGRDGRAATYTGTGCIDWAGGRTADNVAAQGNILTGRDVVDALMDTFVAGGAPFPELLLRALKAADERGGDKRGGEAAALLVVRRNRGYGGNTDVWMDLGFDDHPAPIDELKGLLEFTHLYLNRSPAADLLPIDEPLATEIQHRLE